MNGAVLSPDGRTVAFTSPTGGFDQVFLMLTSGGAALQLTNDSSDKAVDSFSPDGAQIYYEIGLGVGIGYVWTVPTLGGPPSPVVQGAGLVTSTDSDSFFFLNGPGNAVIRKPNSGLEEELVYSPSADLVPFKILPFPNGRELLIVAVKASEMLTMVCNAARTSSSGAQENSFSHITSDFKEFLKS